MTTKTTKTRNLEQILMVGPKMKIRYYHFDRGGVPVAEQQQTMLASSKCLVLKLEQQLSETLNLAASSNIHQPGSPRTQVRSEYQRRQLVAQLFQFQWQFHLKGLQFPCHS